MRGLGIDSTQSGDASASLLSCKVLVFEINSSKQSKSWIERQQRCCIMPESIHTAEAEKGMKESP